MRKILFQSLFLVCFLGVLWFIAAPKAAIYLNNRGMDRYNDGKFEEAVKYLKHSLQLNPKSAITHFNLGNAYIEIKREDDAIAEYKNAIRLDSHLAQAYRALSRVYADRALFEEAIATLKKFRSASPSDNSSDGLLDQVLLEYTQACQDKGAEAYLAGNKDEGYQLLKRAIELRPELPYPYYTIAGFYYSDGDYSSAETGLNSAVQIDDNFFPAHKLLGDVYFAQGKLAKAHGHYMKALTADDSDPGLYHRDRKAHV
jgi:tetratricopeptide (TPR) repeat protein